MQRSYVEFQRFAEQVQMTSPQSEPYPFNSEYTNDSAIIPALPLATTSAVTDEEGMSLQCIIRREANQQMIA
jgi:hypothetical protein